MSVSTAMPVAWLRWAVCLVVAGCLLAAPAGCSGGRKKAKGKAAAKAKAAEDDADEESDAKADAVAADGAAAGDMADGDAADGDKAEDTADVAMVKNGADDEGEWPLPEGVDPDTPTVTDEERIAVFAPKEWARAAQSKDYLVKFIPSRRKTYPSIVVLVTDAPDDFEEVEPEDQKKFVAAVAASLAKTFVKNGKSTLLKKPAAVQLGDHFGATWIAPATVKIDGVNESIDRLSYAVVLAGRMYTVEVRAPKGKLEENDGVKLAKAVAAALRPPEFIPKTEAAAGFTPPPAVPAPAAE